jgi:hypothetical protein
MEPRLRLKAIIKWYEEQYNDEPPPKGDPYCEPVWCPKAGAWVYPVLMPRNERWSCPTEGCEGIGSWSFQYYGIHDNELDNEFLRRLKKLAG